MLSANKKIQRNGVSKGIDQDQEGHAKSRGANEGATIRLPSNR